MIGMSCKQYFGRFSQDDRVFSGFIVGDYVYEIGGGDTLPVPHELGELTWLAPVMPSKVIAIGLNYIDHAQQAGKTIPDKPLVFLKAPTSLIGHKEAIVAPPSTAMLCCEGELAVVIGKKGRFIPEASALDYVFGYTCSNDVSARDLQREDGQWARAKSFDTFCPIGPSILMTDRDPGQLKIEVRVNNKVWQRSNTNQMGHGVRKIISYVSEAMTLLPGDIILTGTPGNTPELKIGDVVYVEIEDIGVLENPVIAERRD